MRSRCVPRPVRHSNGIAESSVSPGPLVPSLPDLSSSHPPSSPTLSHSPPRLHVPRTLNQLSSLNAAQSITLSAHPDPRISPSPPTSPLPSIHPQPPAVRHPQPPTARKRDSSCHSSPQVLRRTPARARTHIHGLEADNPEDWHRHWRAPSRTSPIMPLPLSAPSPLPPTRAHATELVLAQNPQVLRVRRAWRPESSGGF
ncbi:hypothetical protein BV20DRAFT_573233 [Pilatotrama ljubarskyi]|nr:hypothetical protein BV20DRAFT_573233 [Pilatotrama ljubarskyi]